MTAEEWCAALKEARAAEALASQARADATSAQARIAELEKALDDALIRKMETYLAIYTGDKELRGMIERIRRAALTKKEQS